ncbi:MAG: DUF3800 domain-containing protein [Gemmatimonadota bacterium]
MRFNIYCDESGHLERSQSPVMVLGALLCPRETVRHVAERLRRVKDAHGIGHGNPQAFEVKWSKVSSARVDFYRDYMDVLFEEELHFRALVVSDKSRLRHEDFDQTHDDWYYKMYYQTLEPLLDPECSYAIYLDIKDTLSQGKVRVLGDVLRSRLRDYDQTIVTKIQHVRSDEVEQVQLVDLLIGATSYVNRGLRTNEGKTALVEHLRERSGLTLQRTTSRARKKVNLFFWNPAVSDG